MDIYLPSKKDLVVTNKEDPLRFYYWPIAGVFYKKRLKDILKLLGERECDKLLEVGFGSGIFFPELKKRCRRLYGLEIHDKIGEVSDFLLKHKIAAVLERGDIVNMPYSDGFFDAVVSVSTLEHIKDLDKAVSEIIRVLKPNGTLILGFPVRNKITDFIFKIFGNNPRDIHPNSHNDILKAFGNVMTIEKLIYFPGKFLPLRLNLYISVRFRK